MLSFIFQLLYGTLITLEVALCSAFIGMIIGIIGALAHSFWFWLRYPIHIFIFIIRALPELLVLFFIYFGMTQILSFIFGEYIDISPFVASVTALSLIFGSYASHVFRGAFLAIDQGQVAAGSAMGFNSWQLLTRIQLPQAWRHAIPGLGNLWLVLVKDTAIVMLIGLFDLMGQAKLAATTTQQPFTFYLIAAGIYLLITSVSQKIIYLSNTKANRYVH